jgi:hypothetical protein
MDALCPRCVIQAASSGEPDTENEASGTTGAGAIREFLGRGEHISMQVYRLDKISKCLAYFAVIIHNGRLPVLMMNFQLGGRSSPSAG